MSGPRPSPETLPREPGPSRCRPSCCATPFFCATKGVCRCHMSDVELLRAKFARYGR